MEKSLYPDSRFWISEFRIPYGVCKIWNTAPWDRGAAGRTWAAHERATGGCDIRCPRGDPGGL